VPSTGTINPVIPDTVFVVAVSLAEISVMQATDIAVEDRVERIVERFWGRMPQKNSDMRASLMLGFEPFATR
jgi:hypothetical protein